jgi:hypothetical protein
MKEKTKKPLVDPRASNKEENMFSTLKFFGRT